MVVLLVFLHKKHLLFFQIILIPLKIGLNLSPIFKHLQFIIYPVLDLT